MFPYRFTALCCLLASLTCARATITVSGVTNKTAAVAGSSVTVTWTSQAGYTHTPTLNGVPLVSGVPTVVTAPQYHEVKDVKTLTSTGAVTTDLFQFIILAAGRDQTESGLPPFTPYPLLNDAPSAFTGKNLVLVAPTTFPLNTPIPVVGMLRDGVGDPVWLTGPVKATNFPASPLQLRRGWGSVMLPAATAAGTINYAGAAGSATDTASVVIEPTTTWVTKPTTIASDTWGPNQRIDLTASITISGTVTILPDTIVRLAQGVEINVNAGAHLQVSANMDHPVCFVATALDKPWGGIWLKKSATVNSGGRLTTTGAIFASYGNLYNWFPGTSGYSPHRKEQALVLIDNNANCTMTDTYIIDGRGQAFHQDTGTLSLTRSLVHHATTVGELYHGQFDADRCGFIQFVDRPNGATNVYLDDGPGFVDGDNDGLYLVPFHDTTTNVPKTWTLNKCVIGFTKDDGIDTGGSNDGITVLQNSWIEGAVHEAMSHSGTGRVPRSLNSVHFACGQGFECGYEGPLSYMNGSAVIGCMVGTRYGDNYLSGFTYSGTLTVENSIVINNIFQDVWGFTWNTSHGVAAAAWTYGSQWMTINNNYLTKANSYHPNNTVWNPATNGSLLAPYMPVPNSNVGVGWSSLTTTDNLVNLPSKPTVRLSTFSSKPVSVNYQVVGKVKPDSTAETLVMSGTLTFVSGETLLTLPAITLPVGNNFGLVLLRLHSPTNAEVTFPEMLYYKTNSLPNQTPIAKGNAGWSYSAIGAAPAAGWTGQPYTEQAAQWNLNKTAPLGFGNIGAAAPFVVFGTTLPETSVITTYFRKPFTLTNAAQISSMSIQLMVDDSAVIYLNGYEVSRFLIDSGATTGGAINYGTYATSAGGQSGAAESTYNTIAVPASILPHLVEGTNLLAVEVHQLNAAPPFSDMVMDLSLTASYVSGPLIPTYGLGQQNGAPFLYWIDPTVYLECSTNLTNWIKEPTTPSPFFPTPEAPTQRMFWRLTRP